MTALYCGCGFLTLDSASERNFVFSPFEEGRAACANVYRQVETEILAELLLTVKPGIGLRADSRSPVFWPARGPRASATKKIMCCVLCRV